VGDISGIFGIVQRAWTMINSAANSIMKNGKKIIEKSKFHGQPETMKVLKVSQDSAGIPR
jgi:uncharacterized protein YkuJ